MATDRYVRTPAELQQEVDMMLDPMLWPHRYLPLKKLIIDNADGRTDMAYGLLIGDGPIIYIRNLFESTPIDQCESRTYDSFHAIVDDGWVVD